jgi:peroxiredoxin
MNPYRPKKGSRSATMANRPRSGRAPIAAARSPRSRTPWVVAGAAVLAVLGLFAIYHTSSGIGGEPATDRYAVGAPGVGEMAPDFTLPNATAPAAPGGQPATVRLSDYRGKTVLLYFHEGLGCQPCWNQIRDLRNNPSVLSSLGVDQLLTITSGPVDLVGQKMRDDGLTAPALVDTDLRVSAQYQANQFGMMGNSRDGHSFILIGPDGLIEWRGDYGGPPNYTMYVRPDQLATDLRTARQKSGPNP